MAAEFRFGYFDAQHTGQALAHIVTRYFDLGFFGQLGVVNVFVDDARHRGAQAGQMGTAVALRNVVGEAQHLFVVATVPLHRYLNPDVGGLVTLAIAHGVKYILVKYRLSTVDKIHKTLHTAGPCEVVLLAAAFVPQANAHAIVQKTQLAQSLAQYLVMKVVVLLEYLGVGQKMNFGASFFCLPDHSHGRDLDAVLQLHNPVLDKPTTELQRMHFAVAPNREAQHFGQRVHTAHTHTVQPT